MRRLVMVTTRWEGHWRMEWEPNWMLAALLAPMTDEEMRSMLRSETGVGVTFMTLDPDQVRLEVWPEVGGETVGLG